MVGGTEGNFIEKFKDSYFKNYKKILFLPLLLFIICLGQVIYQTVQTGDFIKKDISLKGGITITVITESKVNLAEIREALAPLFAPNELDIRVIETSGNKIGLLIQSDITELPEGRLNEVLETIGSKLGKPLTKGDYSFESMGSSLGQSFFSQTVRAMILAFIFMGIVVFITFRVFVPSIAVISAALSDIVCTIAILNILDIRVGTAGIAALLMLIGYSVDTDILLTSKVLKRKETSVRDAMSAAANTGLMMTFTALAAVIIGIIFSQSDIVTEIMVVLLIGLIIDIFNTWIQNTGLLLWYLERKEKKVVKA